MRDLSPIIRHAEAGGSVKFVINYYGEQWVEYKTGWVLRRKIRVRLSEQEVVQLKAALRRRPGRDTPVAA
jgi:hypothetical protein